MTAIQRSSAFVAIAAVAFGVSISYATPPRFAIYRLGLFDAEHTSALGIQRSFVKDNDPDHTGTSSAVISGLSDRYNGNTDVGDSTWAFNRVELTIDSIGLRTPEFFSGSSGRHRSTIRVANTVGQIVGTTDTDPESSGGADVPWFYDPATSQTLRIGYGEATGQTLSENIHSLTDDGLVYGTAGSTAWVYDHSTGQTTAFGPDESFPVWQGAGPLKNELLAVGPGGIVGASERSQSLSGPPLWHYDHASGMTTPIGFNDAEHARPSGERISRLDAVSGSGLVVGNSRFQVGSTLRTDGWVYDPVTRTTRSIGLANPYDGADWNDEFFGTQGSRVYGESVSADGTRVAWVDDNTTHSMNALGLTDATHTLPGGVTKNQVLLTSQTGFVAGSAARVGTETRQSFNQTPWVFSPLTQTTYATGLTEGSFRLSDGSVWSETIALNDSGQAIGMSVKFGGVAGVVQRFSNWFFDPIDGRTIELVAVLANIRQAQWTNAQLLNDNGVVVGVASGINVGTQWVWLYDAGAKSTRIDFEYQAPAGGVLSDNGDIGLMTLTNSGLVLGRTERLRGSASVGYSDWLYDSNSGVTHSLVFSESKSTGGAYTHVEYLGEDGVIYGEYDAYSDTDQLLGRRYFYWSPEDGFYDLESLLVGDLSEFGWGSLQFDPGSNPLLTAIDQGFLYGFLRNSQGSLAPFALVRVPEPTTAAGVSWAILTAIGQRRRQRWQVLSQSPELPRSRR